MDWTLGLTLAEWLDHEGFRVLTRGFGSQLGRAPRWDVFGQGPQVLAGLRGHAAHVLTSRDPSYARFQESSLQIISTHPLANPRKPGDRIVYLAYPVPEEYFEEDTMKAVFDVTRRFRLEHRPRVVFAGDYTDGAGLSTLFQAVRTVLRGQGELILLNGREYRDQLAPVIKTLGLEEVAIFLPRLTDREESGIFHSADVYVDPSHDSEWFPVGALRAMASRLPIVAWETPLMTSLSNRGALMVSPGRDDAWAPAISEALGNEPLRERMMERTRTAMADHRLAIVGNTFLQLASQWGVPIPTKV